MKGVIEVRRSRRGLDGPLFNSRDQFLTRGVRETLLPREGTLKNFTHRVFQSEKPLISIFFIWSLDVTQDGVLLSLSNTFAVYFVCTGSSFYTCLFSCLCVYVTFWTTAILGTKVIKNSGSTKGLTGYRTD